MTGEIRTQKPQLYASQRNSTTTSGVGRLSSNSVQRRSWKRIQLLIHCCLRSICVSEGPFIKMLEDSVYMMHLGYG